MEGRDIGKIKKQGFFRGTQANLIRFAFVGVFFTGSILIGAFA